VAAQAHINEEVDAKTARHLRASGVPVTARSRSVGLSEPLA
jgi:hypothetical protein